MGIMYCFFIVSPLLYFKLFKAFLAACISASFLLFPVPFANILPLHFTCASKLLSWSGPVSFVISYSIFTSPCICNFSCNTVLWSLLPTCFVASAISFLKFSIINFSACSIPPSKYIAAITASTLSAKMAGLFFSAR